MKLSDWAKREGLCYRTAYNLFKSGNLPLDSYQLDTGTIIVKELDTINSKTVIYSRVSSRDQKDDLKRQEQRLRDYCSKNGIKISEEYNEIASGLNQNRPKLNKILRDSSINTIVVEHKDRLTRFGFNLIESTLNSSNRKIIVLNETENKIDLVQDFIDVITSMCARIYGNRSAKNKAQRVLDSMENT